MPQLRPPLRTAALALIVLNACAPPARAQGVDAQLQELRSAIETLRTQVADARRESDDLRREMEAMRQDLGSIRADDQDVAAAKVDGLEQTKVESGSKYHVRLSGLALLNAALTRGQVDSADLPGVARPALPGQSSGSFTAGARQSYVRLDVFGPAVRGARTSGELTFDFFGGFPATNEGLTSGLARLRTTTLSLDWDRTSLVAGQQAPFFSPLSPTSLVSTAYPALSSAGNIWTWTPQVHVDRRFGLGASTVVVQGGFLDPLTGEPPANEYNRLPTAGEQSRVPAPAVRVGWQRDVAARTASAGAGGYYSREAWGFGRTVDAWAATGDWNVPVGSRVSLSGEAYRGRAIAGLGASAGPSVTFASPPAGATGAGAVLPFESAGGWSQLKVAPVARLEFNAALGTDRSAPARVGDWLGAGAIDAALVGRNTSAFVNGIYLLRSNLVFSIEYRRLQTTTLGGATHRADHVSVGGGVGF